MNPYINPIREITWYEEKTTFWRDFSITELALGEGGVRNMYSTLFAKHKDNYINLTELVMVLKYKYIRWNKSNPSLAKVYYSLWKRSYDFANEQFNDTELLYFKKSVE